jgi:hypothetical protein
LVKIVALRRERNKNFNNTDMQALGDKELITAIKNAKPGEFYFVGAHCWKLKETGLWARFNPSNNKFKLMFLEKTTAELIDSVLDEVNENPELGFIER